MFYYYIMPYISLNELLSSFAARKMHISKIYVSSLKCLSYLIILHSGLSIIREFARDLLSFGMY